MSKLRQATFGLILVAFLATIVLPSAILLWPQKTEAQGSCIAGIISSLFGKLGGMLGGIGGGEVPTKDSATRGNTQKTSGYTGGSFVSDCIIKPLVKNLVKQLIHSFLTSITDWINDGFNGSGPRFVSDPASFFADIADRAIGQVVMGSDLNFLCSPFALDVRLALGLNYWSGGFRDRITCTLSDIINNTMNAADRTAYRNSWQSWLDLTTQPQNNPYGAYALAKSQIEIRIANQQFVAKTEADWGAGFLSTKRCVESDEGEALEADLDMGVDPCIKYETVTPGKMIQEGISSSLQAEVSEYVAAEDLDAIFGALMNQLIGSVFKATGLFTGGGRSNSNYYQNQFRQQIADGTFNVYKQLTSDNGAMELVSCNDPSDSHYIQNYTLSANDTAVMFFNKSLTTPAWEDITNRSNPFLVNRTQTRVIDYQQAQNYCAKNRSWNAVQATIDNLENSIATQSSNQCSQQSKLYSTDFRPPTASNFESDLNGVNIGGGPDLAIDGNSLTYARVQGGWLEFTLNRPEMISSINIQAREISQRFKKDSVINFYETLTSAPLSISKTLISDAVSFTPNLSTPIRIQKIRMESANNIFVSEVTLNRYISPIVNWSGSSSAKINKQFDVLNGVTATKCTDDSVIPNSGVSFTITSPSGATPPNITVNLVTFTTAGTYTVTYKANDGVTDASFTRTIVVN